MFQILSAEDELSDDEEKLLLPPPLSSSIVQWIMSNKMKTNPLKCMVFIYMLLDTCYILIYII